MQIQVIQNVTKTIGSLALAYPYLRRLGIAETVDSMTTAGKEREVPTGQVIEILALNRLSLRPTPMSKLGDWARHQAIEEVYGLAPEALNDDRIGRALDEIHPHLTDAWAAIVLRGAREYGIGLGQLHGDVTRLAFEGAYEEVPTETEDGRPLPKVTYGFTGKEDPTRKQVTLSMSVAADGAVPAWYRVADGNAPDTRAYLAHLGDVRQHLGLDKPLVVGDSKLISRSNMLGFCRIGARFVGPTSLSQADRKTLLVLWQGGEAMHWLDVPVQDTEDEPDKGREVPAARYWGLETGEELEDPERGTTYRLRRLFVQSLADRKAARHQRAKDLARARAALWTIKGRLGRPVYRDRALVERKAAEGVSKVKGYLEVEIVQVDGGLDLRWRLNRKKLREDAQFDGIYCVLTNWADATMQEVFRAYKCQSRVEGRFRAVKHPPIQVRPVWLHQPHRIESLVFVVMVAIFLFALVEREARRVVKESGRVFEGLRPAKHQDKLPVTAERMFEVFGPLGLAKQQLRVGDELADVVTPATLSPIQAQILDRLGLMKPEEYLQATVTSHPL